MCCQRRKRSLRIELLQTNHVRVIVLLVVCSQAVDGCAGVAASGCFSCHACHHAAGGGVQTLAHNPALLSAQQNLLSMKGQEVEAGLRANPDFAFSGSDVSLSTTNPASPYFYSASLSRLFERGQKRRWRLDSARASTAQTEAQYHDQIRQTTLQVKQNFTNLLLAKATLKLAQDNLSSFSHELQINHDRYDAGDIGKLDYERLDLQLAQFESDESNAEMNLVQASDQLQTLMGIVQPSRTFDIAGDLVPRRFRQP